MDVRMNNEHPIETKNQKRKALKKLKRERGGIQNREVHGSHQMEIQEQGHCVVDLASENPMLELQEPHMGFTVIGETKQFRKVKLPPFLPAWYSSPSPISGDLHTNPLPVEELPGLDSQLRATLKDQGIDTFFPVQQIIIPEVLQYQNFQRYFVKRPPDLCICAPTGSGKTLAYVLPILQDLIQRPNCKVRALVLLPVKELAVQVADVFETFAKGTRVKIALVCGKFSLEQERRQMFHPDPVMECLTSNKYMDEALLSSLKVAPKCAVDLIVTTPGRLVDHLYDTPDLDLTSLEYLVVDEADRMIEELKNNWFRLLERAVFKNANSRPAFDYSVVSHFEQPTPPLQKLLFSATLSYDPQRFETLKLYHPKLFAVVSADISGDIMMRNDEEVIGTYSTPEELKELTVEADPQLKPLVLLHLIHNLGWKRILVFTNSLESTHRLFLLLKLFHGKRKITIHEISSNVHQRKRQAALDGFDKGSVDVIVASDSMARGIDLPNVEYVVLYDAPLHAKTYIHRSGRTARAGKPGTTLTMLKQNEKKSFMLIMKELRKRMPEQMDVTTKKLAPMEEQYKIALKNLEVELQPRWT